MATAIWTGKSNMTYEYTVYDPRVKWNDKPGNYIFASLINGRWKAHYIGQTDSFECRFSNHEKWLEAVRHGTTHVHARVNQSKQARLNEELDLIQSNQPACNDLLKSA